MSKFKKVLLNGLLISCLAILPVPLSAYFGEDGEHLKPPKTERSETEDNWEDSDVEGEDRVDAEKVAARFNFGVYYGRPYYYRPYYHYYPYRPYYYRNYNYPYRPYNRPYYRW